ncbi:MAG: HepT-like ribonuclease domain-containing protein [bacterium]|nr:HepT-like ribonuclease domain-containing protein [bacterium]
MNEKDEVRLRDMLDAAHDAQSFLIGRDRQTLDEEKIFAFALVRAIELIGEAASRVTEETRSAHPQVPWKSIINMRHRMIHNYRDVDLDIVWETATVYLPTLIVQLKAILPADES